MKVVAVSIILFTLSASALAATPTPTLVRQMLPDVFEDTPTVGVTNTPTLTETPTPTITPTPTNLPTATRTPAPVPSSFNTHCNILEYTIEKDAASITHENLCLASAFAPRDPIACRCVVWFQRAAGVNYMMARCPGEAAQIISTTP